MSIFKNANEAAFVGGRKHWTDVIKNTGPASGLIWKQPEEDFNTNSTLIVMPGEQAVFVNGGTIEQVFDNGTYKLSTQNYPFISRLRNMFSGGVSVFNCVVYFVRTADSVELLWGTASPIQVRDKTLGIATRLRARGSYKVQVEKPELFLTRLVGSNRRFVGQQSLIDEFFANEFQGKIRAQITRCLNETENELLGIEDHIEELSAQIQPSLQDAFTPYGLNLVKFSIASMDIMDDELRRRYDEIGMDSIAKLRNAQADKGVQQILGDGWAKQQSVDILRTLADNPAGGAAAAGAGIGAGIAAGGAFANMAAQAFAPAQPAPQPAAQPAPVQEDPVAALKKLKVMLDAGLIPQEAYDKKMNEILSRM